MKHPNIALVYEVLGAYQQGEEERIRELMASDAEIYDALEAASGLAAERT